MTDKATETEAARRARLQAVLDAYGADPERWPERDRAELADLLAQDTGISQAVDDARALDRLLDQASAPRVRDGAAAGILAVLNEDGEAAVVPFETARRADRGAAAMRRRLAWPAAGLMAASLLVGVFLGQSEFLNDTVAGTFLTADSAFDEIDDALFGLRGGVIPFTEDTL